MKRLSLTLSRKSLLTIYKSFVRPDIIYADIIYDKIEMVQYRAALVITGAINGTSRDRLYQELGLESLVDRRWSRRLFSSTKLHKDSYHLILKLIVMLLVKECVSNFLRNGVNSTTK